MRTAVRTAVVIAAVVAVGFPEAVGVAAASAAPVVSYLVAAGADSSVEIPNEAFPDRRLARHPWQWRIFDPTDGRDTLFLNLPAFPTRIRWESRFQVVEYAIGNRVERAAWRLGAKPEVQAVLPVDSCLCDYWSDTSGQWHVVTQREVAYHPRPGYESYRQFVTRWDLEPSGKWRAAAEDTLEDPYGGCEASDHLARGFPRAPVVLVGALLDSMTILNQRDSILHEVVATKDEAAGWLAWVPSNVHPAIGLEVKAEQGDDLHAMEPVVWVDREGERRTTVYARGESRYDAFGQIALAQRGQFLLVVAEYSGAYPVVADMRTGKVLFRVSRPSARAVWVRAPW